MSLNFLDRYRQNWRLLHAETDRIGAQVEQWSYDRLNRDAENQPFIEHTIGEVSVSFHIDRYDMLPNRDLCICINTKSKLPTLLGIKPSYRFYKRTDGTVYY